MIVDTRGSGRRAKQCDAGRVAAEGLDIVADPFDRQALVEEAQIIWHLVRVGMARKAENAETVAVMCQYIQAICIKCWPLY